MTLDLAVIILNYRTAQLTNDCLASMEAEIEPGISVVVVDNASGDGSADAIERSIEDRGWSRWARVLRSPTNGGFAAGNNFGVRSVEAAAYLLLNSDTLVRPGAFRELLRAAALHPEAGIIGSGLLDSRGQPDSSFFRLIGPISELIRAAHTGPVSRLLQPFDPYIPPTEQPLEVAWLGFASVLIRREVFDAIGPLDEGFFMYFEDVDYCRRAREAGWHILYWPSSKVVHLLGGSSQVTAAEAQRRRGPRYYYEARARYFGKYYGRRGLWLANGLWYLGRAVALPRELLGRARAQREHEARDIWINAIDPLATKAGK